MRHAGVPKGRAPSRGASRDPACYRPVQANCIEAPHTCREVIPTKAAAQAASPHGGRSGRHRGRERVGPIKSIPRFCSCDLSLEWPITFWRFPNRRLPSDPGSRPYRAFSPVSQHTMVVPVGPRAAHSGPSRKPSLLRGVSHHEPNRPAVTLRKGRMPTAEALRLSTNVLSATAKHTCMAPLSRHRLPLDYDLNRSPTAATIAGPRKNHTSPPNSTAQPGEGGTTDSGTITKALARADPVTISLHRRRR